MENFHSLENENIIYVWKHILLHGNTSLSNENIPVLNENIFDWTLLISATIVY